MREIVGNTIATPVPQSDWNQADATKADYIKNKPAILTEEEVVRLIEENGIDAGVQSDWNQTDETKSDYIKNKPMSGDVVASEISDKQLILTQAPWLMIKGEDGKTPQKGVDYFTESEQEEFLAECKRYTDEAIGEALEGDY